ncbi:helix-turn-helix domain-containing protein [Vibrio mediterranei]|uniref:helix-turn-helix domain-containing protein n=1 Tax=Vibrio mediterranei TaxID=689 RepID=UPI001EFE2B24|nr:helix-turn-helix transcriptional regulator [Vibrio mediterranei]MCG9657651.1 helix-turn-helix domain-containing protein [Vibrio mediterranei]
MDALLNPLMEACPVDNANRPIGAGWSPHLSLNALISQAQRSNTSVSALLGHQPPDGRPPVNRFGASLHFKRLTLGISQRELCRELNITLNSLRNWEYRQGNPNLTSLMALCQCLDCDIDALITDRSDYGLHAHTQRLSTWLSA